MKTSIGLGLTVLASVASLAACSDSDASKLAGGSPGQDTPGAPLPSDGNPDEPQPGESDGGTGSPSTPGADASSPEQPAEVPVLLASDVSIAHVAIFQGVKVSLVQNGQAVANRNAPVVAGRPALVRVYVTPEVGAKSITAQLTLTSGGVAKPVVQHTKTIAAASTDDNLDSTFNFEVAAADLTTDTTFKIALTATDGAEATGASPARFPQDGSLASLGAKRSGKLKVVVVPVQYNADGSGRMPDVSAAQLQRYKEVMMARYPATDVEVTTRATVTSSIAINAAGSGYSQMLTAIQQLRQSDGVASDVYYYGAVAPANSFNAFCGQSCVTGLSTVVESASTSVFRASVGMGFTGAIGSSTMAHELGHAHGRYHAPCGGPSGVDSSFPYADGTIGVWGYDILAKTLFSPEAGHDMMSYCKNEWVSDYTFAALFTRIAAVSPQTASASLTTLVTTPRVWRFADVAADGTLQWTHQLETSEALEGGDAHAVMFVDDADRVLANETAHFYRYDHLPGGVLVVPQPPTGSAAARAFRSARIQGFAHQLTR
ncbi:hypothetical protein AKJ09_09414 [Labilithrix luteola]|uniref:Uncharacterized protein n=1 Tax=Labilithrix luteola TaxID=1391654 RepID=A0A0K1QAE5_9BACT|nr:hypothetical protein [Labilithrix luteola]AKV02751.1 hypothetical protein AKJ09_09414 [Labilithrix luteola]